MNPHVVEMIVRDHYRELVEDAHHGLVHRTRRESGMNKDVVLMRANDRYWQIVENATGANVQRLKPRPTTIGSKRLVSQFLSWFRSRWTAPGLGRPVQAR